MKKMQIFEPALCCDTGVCGASVDTELLRITTVLNTLRENGVVIDRFNLKSAPMEFVTNQTVNVFVNQKGAEALPCVLVDGNIVIEGRYPTNEEILTLLELSPESMLPKTKDNGGCCCNDNCCSDENIPEGCCTDDSCCEAPEPQDNNGGCCCSGGGCC